MLASPCVWVNDCRGQSTSGSGIAYLIHILSDPIEYMGRVVSNFAFYGYDREAPAIRIGVTGVGCLSKLSD